MTAALPDSLRADVETLWSYHDMHHEIGAADVGIGLGSHDLGVASCAADLFHRGVFPLIVFTGANAPTTVSRFPLGEAVHYREHAVTLGVPEESILVEPAATNTGREHHLRPRASRESWRCRQIGHADQPSLPAAPCLCDVREAVA